MMEETGGKKAAHKEGSHHPAPRVMEAMSASKKNRKTQALPLGMLVESGLEKDPQSLSSVAG